MRTARRSRPASKSRPARPPRRRSTKPGSPPMGARSSCAARLRVGEEEALRGERQRAQHAERFANGIAEIAGLLAEDEPSAAGRVARARRVVADLARLDAAFSTVGGPLESADAHIEDAL